MKRLPFIPSPSNTSTRRGRVVVLGFALLISVGAVAGGRARYGGTLQVAVVGKGTTEDPLLADTPTDAAAVRLTQTPLCRLAEATRPTPTTLRLALPEQVEPSAVVPLLLRLQHTNGPLSAMLEGVTRIAEAGHAVELGNAPVDLERALCHPAFSVKPGPFRATGKGLVAVSENAEGRPYVDQVALTLTDARAAERLLAQRRAHVVLGSSQADDAPQLFVLALVFSPQLAPHLRAALEATIDRADLVRFFVKPPSAPMTGLLPPSLGGPTAAAPRPARPVALNPAREVTLWFDGAADDEHAIAERLQLKLQPLGYRVALKASTRDELRGRALAEGELKLVNTLLPPSPTQATAVMLALGGQRERIAQLRAQLPSAEPDVAARQFALTALPELPLWPLATRGLGITTAPDVQHLTRDALGLPRLDDVFLANE